MGSWEFNGFETQPERINGFGFPRTHQETAAAAEELLPLSPAARPASWAGRRRRLKRTGDDAGGGSGRPPAATKEEGEDGWPGWGASWAAGRSLGCGSWAQRRPARGLGVAAGLPGSVAAAVGHQWRGGLPATVWPSGLRTEWVEGERDLERERGEKREERERREVRERVCFGRVRERRERVGFYWERERRFGLHSMAVAELSREMEKKGEGKKEKKD